PFPFINPRSVMRTIIVDGLLAAMLSLVIVAFSKLRAEIGHAEHVIHEKELRERKLAEAVAVAQAQALPTQLNPPFFFNTINTISALIPEDSQAARDLVGHLAEMFRYTLRSSRAELVELADELAFVKSYLELEQARLRGRLTVDWRTEADLCAVKLPSLT